VGDKKAKNVARKVSEADAMMEGPPRENACSSRGGTVGASTTDQKKILHNTKETKARTRERKGLSRRPKIRIWEEFGNGPNGENKRKLRKKERLRIKGAHKKPCNVLGERERSNDPEELTLVFKGEKERTNIAHEDCDGGKQKSHEEGLAKKTGSREWEQKQRVLSNSHRFRRPEEKPANPNKRSQKTK